MGAGVLRWEREASELLYGYLRAEREKDWKRLRHQLVLRGPMPEQAQQLGPERVAEINRLRLKVRFRKFWDLMNEADRPWHFDEVLHLCTELSPYTCERYSIVTAATMQGILAQRAKAEKAVREEREGALKLRRRITGAAIKMQRTGRPLSEEQMAQMRLLLQQVSAGAGIAKWQLGRLQQAAATTYQDKEYVQHVENLLPLLEETRLVTAAARQSMLPEVEALQDELLDFQADMDERRLSRDQVLDFLDALRNRTLACQDPDGWAELTPDEEVSWRYPPRAYWRPKPSQWWAHRYEEADSVGWGARTDEALSRQGRREGGWQGAAGEGAHGVGGAEEQAAWAATRREGRADGRGDGGDERSRRAFRGWRSEGAFGARGSGEGDADAAMMSMMMSSFGDVTEGRGVWGNVAGDIGVEDGDSWMGDAAMARTSGSSPLPGMFD